MKNSGSIRIGIGGWVFPPWRGTFYPAGLRQAEELSFASRQVSAIEINGTFYRIQNPASFKKWHDEAPADFAYLGLRRCAEAEPTGYPEGALDEWAERLTGWAAEGRDCFLYFINGAKTRAPAAAQALLQRLIT